MITGVEPLGVGHRVEVRLSDGTSRITLPQVLEMNSLGPGSPWRPEYDGSPLVLRHVTHWEDRFDRPYGSGRWT